MIIHNPFCLSIRQRLVKSRTPWHSASLYSVSVCMPCLRPAPDLGLDLPMRPELRASVGAMCKSCRAWASHLKAATTTRQTDGLRLRQGAKPQAVQRSTTRRSNDVSRVVQAAPIAELLARPKRVQQGQSHKLHCYSPASRLCSRCLMKLLIGRDCLKQPPEARKSGA